MVFAKASLIASVLMCATVSTLSAQSAQNFVPVTPCRIADTRLAAGPFGGPILAGNSTRSFAIPSSACNIPPTATAYSLNVTVVPTGGLAYLSIWPTGVSQPVVSTLNDFLNTVVANAAIVQAGTSGAISVYVTDQTHLVLDIDGYFVAQTALSSSGTSVALGAGSSDTGTQNTAIGVGVLQNNTGPENTGLGFGALGSNTTGFGNTAVGQGALANNMNSQNTAIGAVALTNNTTGFDNTAGGIQSLWQNTTGSANTAFGAGALDLNTTGQSNTAFGFASMHLNSTASYNTALGLWSLGTLTSGDNNIAVGNYAGYILANGSYNIYIGGGYNYGGANESNVIRIGSPNQQTASFIAGIRGITTGNNDAIPVYIDSTGQLGTISSSQRFKKDIDNMGDATSNLMRLRPVTFRYKQPFADGSEPIQYGLIAEEVGEVYPELVAHSADGQVETVKYQVLDSMLLNEYQKQQKKITEQQTLIESLESRLAKLEQLLQQSSTAQSTNTKSSNKQ